MRGPDPNGKLIAKIPCLVGISSLAFVPPFQMISGHQDGSIRVWSLNNPNNVVCERFLTAHTEMVRALAVSTNCFISGSYDNSIAVWYPNRPVTAPVV
jgi:WD40 repeat protein